MERFSQKDICNNLNLPQTEANLDLASLASSGVTGLVLNDNDASAYKLLLKMANYSPNRLIFVNLKTVISKKGRDLAEAFDLVWDEENDDIGASVIEQLRYGNRRTVVWGLEEYLKKADIASLLPLGLTAKHSDLVICLETAPDLIETKVLIKDEWTLSYWRDIAFDYFALLKVVEWNNSKNNL